MACYIKSRISQADIANIFFTIALDPVNDDIFYLKQKVQDNKLSNSHK